MRDFFRHGVKAVILASAAAVFGGSAWAENVKIGLNYPKTGPYLVQGLDQLQASQLAVEEINAAGGIDGKPIELVIRDSQSNASVSNGNALELIEKEGVKAIFGGSASSVAIAVGRVADAHKVPFFGTLTYATETTGEEGKKFVFRECYDSYAGSQVLGAYIKKNFAGKKFYYVTARYNWGTSTEKTIRAISGTEDIAKHSRTYTPFPTSTEKDFVEAMKLAKAANPDVLVLVEFGNDMVQAIKEARRQGIQAQIVVPNLTLGMAEGAGPEMMEGVVGAIPWTAQVPFLKNYPRGKAFVDKFVARYNRQPDTSGASAYTILFEYKAAVERAKSFDGPAVVKALEDHHYTSLKDEQYWRAWDHQSVQTVYAVKCRKAADVKSSKLQQDYFEIIGEMPGDKAFISREQWNEVRKAAGKPTELK